MSGDEVVPRIASRLSFSTLNLVSHRMTRQVGDARRAHCGAERRATRRRPLGTRGRRRRGTNVEMVFMEGRGEMARKGQNLTYL